MKKIISLLLGVALVLTLAACGCSKDDVTPTDAPATSTDVNNDVSNEIDSNSEVPSSDGTVESSLNVQESYFTYKGTKKLNNKSEVIGKAIDFTIGANVTVYSGKHIQPKVATSYSQLTKIYNAANGTGYKDTNYISKYNEEFFVDKAIIMLFLETDDGRSNKYPYNIESVTVDGNSVYVNQSERKSLNVKYSSVMRYYRVLLEVNKRDLNNANLLYDALWEIIDDRSIPYKDLIKLNSENDVIGRSINFKTVMQDQIRIRRYDPALYPVIATTYSDLAFIYDSTNIISPNNNDLYYIRNYNEAFFNNKAVIFMFERYGRGADTNPCTMESVTVDGDTLYVNRSIVNLYDELIDYTGQINYYLTIIEIDKADLKNVERLVCGYIKK